MMNIHDATEQAYKNGYAQGKADAAREIFEELNKEYGSLAFLDNVPSGHIQIFITKIKKIHAGNAPDTNVGGKTECQADGKGEWISVEERLPTWEDGKVLVFTTYGFSVCERTVNGRWRGKHANCITHWMPLPDAPKGE